MFRVKEGVRRCYILAGIDSTLPDSHNIRRRAFFAKKKEKEKRKKEKGEKKGEKKQRKKSLKKDEREKREKIDKREKREKRTKKGMRCQETRRLTRDVFNLSLALRYQTTTASQGSMIRSGSTIVHLPHFQQFLQFC